MDRQRTGRKNTGKKNAKIETKANVRNAEKGTDGRRLEKLHSGSEGSHKI